MRQQLATIQGRTLFIATVSALALGSSGCRAIGDIFKAGVGVGVVVVIAIVAIVGGIAAMLRR
jgi:hypothetical protein